MEMDTSQPIPTRSLLRTLWLLPVIFAVHDAEELVTMPRWLTSHRLELEQIAALNPLLEKMVHSLALTTPQVAIAIGFLLFVFLVVTAGAARSPRRGFWIYAYASLLGVLFLHVFTHVGQALLVRGYAPGVIGAVVVIIPGAIFIYRRLFAAQLLSWKSAVVTGLIGMGLFVPGVLLAQQIGRLLWGG